MTTDRRIEAVAEALDRPGPYLGCTHPNDVGRYVGPCHICDALAAVDALDRYDREHAPASRDAKWIAHHDDALREQIARDIEAEREAHPATKPDDVAYDIGMTDAARIARGGAL